MTGLLYVAIVALWAAVLIPMWLRRHDDDQARRIERHRTAMGTLAGMRRGDESRPRGSAARRRIMVLASLGALVLLTGAAWAMGMASGWWVLVAVTMTALFGAGIVITQRMEAHAKAQRALERSASAREARQRLRVHVNPEQEDLRERPLPTRSVSAPAWDEVFDQTA